eukprot:jgi/Hompol1/3345/HPOL_006479-RA
MLRVVGVERLHGATHDVLVDVAGRVLEQLARAAAQAALAAGRRVPTLSDAVFACSALGVDERALLLFAREWKSQQDRFHDRRARLLAAHAAKLAALAPAPAPAPAHSSDAVAFNPPVIPPPASSAQPSDAAAATTTTATTVEPTNPDSNQQQQLQLSEPQKPTSLPLSQQPPEDRPPPVLGFPRMDPGPLPLNPDLLVEDGYDSDFDSKMSDIDHLFESKDKDTQDQLPFLPPLPTESEYEQAVAPQDLTVPQMDDSADNPLLLDLDDEADADDVRAGRNANPYAHSVHFAESRMAAAGRKPAVFAFSQTRRDSTLVQPKTQTKTSEQRADELLVKALKSASVSRPPDPVISNEDMLQFLSRRRYVGITSHRYSVFMFERCIMDDIFVMSLPSMFGSLGSERIP